MPREVPFGLTDNANVVLRNNNDKLAIRIVIDHDAPINRWFTGVRHTGANYLSPGNVGYGYGDGGIIRLRICPMTAGGLPNLAATVASEQVAGSTLHARRGEYSGATTTSGTAYWMPRTPGGAIWTHPAGEAWWYVLDNVHSDPANNWISWNGVDPRPTTGGDSPSGVALLGPNGVNFPFTPRPANSYAISGLDPREVVAWTTGGDNGSWQFGAVGGLAGASRPAHPGGGPTGYYDSPKCAQYGWSEVAGAVKAQFGQPFGYLGTGSSSTNALRVDGARRTVTVTHVGSCHQNPGTITFQNLTTGLSSTCSTFTSHNGGVVRRGALATPVVVNAGDNFQISCTSAVQVIDPDSSTFPFFDVGLTTTTRKWYRAGQTSIDLAAMLWCDPWPEYEAAAAADTTPPSVSLNMTNGQVLTTSTEFTATASDASGIARVDFLVDGVFRNSEVSAPYTTDPFINPADYAVGSLHTLTARAFDNAGNSAEVTRTFQANVSATVDNTPPVLTVNLGSGTTLTGATNTITATATDASGILKVDFLIDGVFHSTDASSPFTTNIDATAYSAGTTHTLLAIALDDSTRLTANQESLETDASGWEAKANTTIARTTAQFFTGAASLEATAVGTGTVTVETTPGVGGLPIIPATLYGMTIRVRPTTAGTNFTYGMRFYDALGNLVGTQLFQKVLTQNTWNYLFATAAPVGLPVAFATLLVSADLTAGQTFCVDDATFAPAATISRTFQAAGTPPSPNPDPCAAVEASLVAVTAQRDAALAELAAGGSASALVIAERDAALAANVVVAAQLAAANTKIQNAIALLSS